jgi:hypothetical protein
MKTKDKLEVDWMDERKFRKWLERFARFCMYWTFDEVELSWIHPSLDFLFHDFIIHNEEKV